MFDLLVIGAGPGGYTAAARAAKLGLSTAIVEERSWGGTCLNRGCIPTKTLLHASEVYRSAADGAAIGIHAEGLQADIPEIFAYKERISRQLCGGVESLLKGAGVTLLRGRAVITAPGSVRVTGEDGGDYEARRILIATGSVPVRPPIPGLELAMTSDGRITCTAPSSSSAGASSAWSSPRFTAIWGAASPCWRAWTGCCPIWIGSWVRIWR